MTHVPGVLARRGALRIVLADEELAEQARRQTRHRHVRAVLRRTADLRWSIRLPSFQESC